MIPMGLKKFYLCKSCPKGTKTIADRNGTKTISSQLHEKGKGFREPGKCPKHSRTKSSTFKPESVEMKEPTRYFHQLHIQPQ